MTSLLAIDPRAKKAAKDWHSKLNGNFGWILNTGNTVLPNIELGKIYFNGSAGNFDYQRAIKYFDNALSASFSPYDLRGKITGSENDQDWVQNSLYLNDLDRQNDLALWDKDAIARIKALKSVRFDGLLNRLRAEIHSSIDSTLETVAETLCQAAYDFVTTKTPSAQAKQELSNTCITAIGDIHRKLVNQNVITLLTQLLGAIASICSLGIANYITDRSMYGLFSSKIDAAVKLGNLLEALKYSDNGNGQVFSADAERVDNRVLQEAIVVPTPTAPPFNNK